MSNSDKKTILDEDSVLQFWNNRAKKMGVESNVNLSNLEPDVDLAIEKQKQERLVLDEYVNPQSGEKMLDLGAGHCAWATYFSQDLERVDCVEYSSQMVKVANEFLAQNQIQNVTVFCQPAQTYQVSTRYDVILISGLLIYLNPEDFDLLLSNLESLLADGGRVILRDGTATTEAYTINSRYSEELEANYSAHYRTADRYIEDFAARGFQLVRHQNMFPTGSPLNKWEETILRIYEFRRANAG